MIAARFRTPASLALIGALAVMATFVGWLAVRTTATAIVGEGRVQVGGLVERQPEYVLGRALGSFVRRRGQVPAAELPAVRAAAARIPLDARPYLLIGSDYLRRRKVSLAVRALEQGRHLNPRQRWIHLLLLDRYLRGGRYTDAAEQLAVLSRLVGGAQAPVAIAMAQMSVAPETRGPVRQILREDATLERSVLTALAGTRVDPAIILNMASPRAYAAASEEGGWGSVLVDRLVKERRYRAARAVWQHVYRIAPAQAAVLLYDSGLQGLPGRPPFNWRTASSNIAAAEIRANRLEVSYYGRETGELVEQLLMLPPGSYRFTHVLTGGQRSGGSTMQWSVGCYGQTPPRPLGQFNLPMSASAPRAMGMSFTVPANCPAQLLRLSGYAGEFPTPTSVTIDRVRLARTATR